MKKEGKLYGWKQIKTHLKEWSLRTLQFNEKKWKLPVYRLDDPEDGKKPRVYAFEDELDEWKEKRLKVRKSEGMKQAEQENQGSGK